LDSEDVALIVIAVLTLMIFGGLAVLWMAMSNRRALREMEHRERLAMIQRGLMPAPEADPLGFEAAMAGTLEGGNPRSEKWRTAGITFVGLGLGLMLLLSFAAGEPGVGIGVGGAFAILGGALIVNSAQVTRSSSRYRSHLPSSPPPPPSTPGDPPSTAAP
jgi:hypothetical protein